MNVPFPLNKDTKRQAVQTRTNFRGRVAIEDFSKTSVNSQIRADSLPSHAEDTVDRLANSVFSHTTISQWKGCDLHGSDDSNSEI